MPDDSPDQMEPWITTILVVMTIQGADLKVREAVMADSDSCAIAVYV